MIGAPSRMESVAQFDVIVLGGGPAGMSAAVWCADLHLTALLVERESDLGGQLLRIYAPIRNYLGVETKNGQELRDRFLGTFPAPACDMRLGEDVNLIDLENKTIEFENRDVARANALIIATGVRRRKLGVDGEAEFAGRGILTSGAKEKESVRGSTVVVIGGGDAAMENALILSESAASVIVIHRREKFSARTHFLDAAKRKPNIEIRSSCEVKRFLGDGRLTGVEVSTLDGSTSTISASYALVRVGVEPNSEQFKGQLELDRLGYIHVSRYCETSMPGIYAIGDVAFPAAPTIGTAVGSAATACKHIDLICKNMQKTTKS